MAINLARKETEINYKIGFWIVLIMAFLQISFVVFENGIKLKSSSSFFRNRIKLFKLTDKIKLLKLNNDL